MRPPVPGDPLPVVYPPDFLWGQYYFRDGNADNHMVWVIRRGFLGSYTVSTTTKAVDGDSGIP